MAVTARHIRRNAAIEGAPTMALFVETEHRMEPDVGRVRMCTAVSTQDFDRRIGGVRVVVLDSDDAKVASISDDPTVPIPRKEVADLAHAMGPKCSLAGLPADGEKTVVYLHQRVSAEVQTQILFEHLEVLRGEDPGVIYGPDMNCNEAFMTALAEEHDSGLWVAGLLEGHGGLSIDREGYTAIGCISSLRTALEVAGKDPKGMRVAVQGWGAVGAHSGVMAVRELGMTLVAASVYVPDEKAVLTMLATDGGALDAERLFAIWEANPRASDAAFKTYAIEEEAQGRARTSRVDDAIFRTPAEVFIPAARTDVLAMPDQLDTIRKTNVDCYDVTAYARDSKVAVVVEGANHPLSPAAETFLESKGVLVLPDYLVNCGGLIGCWFDWVHRDELTDAERGEAAGDDLDVYLKQRMRSVTRSNVIRVMDEWNAGVSLRQRADTLAQKLKQEHLVRFRDVGDGADTDTRAVAMRFHAGDETALTS